MKLKTYKSTLLVSAITIFLCFMGCSNSKNKQSVIEKSANEYLPLPKKVIPPEDNLGSPEKVALGKLLFYDPILSGNRDVSCATCHHPTNGYAEFRDISIGVNGEGFGTKRDFNTPNDIPFVKRNSQTILNTAFNGIDIHNAYTSNEAPMFWDSRVQSLEKQALEPIKALEEMRGRGHTETGILDEVVSRLEDIPEYQQLFKVAFEHENAINAMNIGKAIAAFERTLITSNSRFDNYLRGDSTSLSLSEKEGFLIFKKVGCANCHKGAMFSDYKTHVLGITENDKLSVPDSGTDESFAFRTPSLRNLRMTAPYMHNGSFMNLKRVLEFYEEIAAGKTLNPNISREQLDPLLKGLTIKPKDMNLIISFLNTLNGTDFDTEIPKAVPSGLQVGGNIGME